MPDHEIEGSDYTTINGHRAYKDTPPATVDASIDYNSVYRGLMRLLLDSGVALAASGAAAQAENWVRILMSVRRVSRKLNSATALCDGNIFGPTLLDDVFFYQIISDGTDRPGAEFDFDLDPKWANKLMVISNETLSQKSIWGGDSNRLVRIEPKEAITFLGVLRSGATDWVPLARHWDALDQTVAITTNPQIVTVGAGVKSVYLTGTIAADSVVRLAENDALYAGLSISVLNHNTNRLIVGSTVTSITMKTGMGCVFKYDAGLASGSKWVAMRARTTLEIVEDTGNLFYTDARVRSAMNVQFPLTHTSITAASSVTPPLANTMLRLGGSYAGNVTLVENDGNYADHVLIVENDTTEILYIGSTNNRRRIEKGNLIFFKYDANRSTGFKWVPQWSPSTTDEIDEGGGNIFFTNARADARIAAALASQSFSFEFRATAGALLENLGGGTANYKSSNGAILLSITELATFTVDMGNHGSGGTTINLRITGVSAGQIPAAARMTPITTNGALVQVLVDGVAETWMVRLSGGNAGWLAFWRRDSSQLSALDTHTVKIPAQTIVWANF